LGYVYVVAPVGLGALLMLLVAIVMNIISNRKYPHRANT
jgi:CBS-domain-containing membrane protein